MVILLTVAYCCLPVSSQLSAHSLLTSDRLCVRENCCLLYVLSASRNVDMVKIMSKSIIPYVFSLTLTGFLSTGEAGRMSLGLFFLSVVVSL